MPTTAQLHILNNLPKDILIDLEIIYKPHPGSKLDLSFSSLSMNFREDPISSYCH